MDRPDGEPLRGVDSDLLKLGEAIEGAVDAELQRLDQPDELDRIRRKRLEEMKRTAAEKMAWKAKGHGSYEELPSEKDFFTVVKDSDRVVCHFNRDSSRPCRILDEHLGKLAPAHLETKFVKLNAEKSPFLTQKFNIRMLPTIALVKGGKVVDYVVGFDELGGQENFPTSVLEARLVAASVLEPNEDAHQS